MLRARREAGHCYASGMPPHKAFTRHRLSLRQHTTEVLTWGEPAATPVLLLHGWMDVAASFQFLVDALKHDWYVIAPDQRGYGGTEPYRENAGGYWFPEYVADLDAVLDHFSPTAPVHLVGHSLGGNVCTLYAGLRPTRVARLVSLDGFGLPAVAPDKAAERYVAWLDAIRTTPNLASYASRDDVADRLQRNNPRLSRERALWLAGHWAQRRDDGRWHLQADPAHKLPFPTLYRLDEMLTIWRRIEAPTLWLGASESEAKRWLGYDDSTLVPAAGDEVRPDSFAARLMAIRHLRFEIISGAGHMLHHDQPERVAARVEAHLLG